MEKILQKKKAMEELEKVASLAESVNAHKSKVPKLPALNVAMAS